MTITNQLIGKNIYIRVSLGSGKQFRIKTPLSIESKDWNPKTQRPIKYEKDNEKWEIHLKLEEVHKIIRIKHIRDSVKGVPANQKWLKEIIYDYFNQKDFETKNLFTSYIQEYIDNAPYRDTINGIGLSYGRIKGLKVFKKMWLRFEDNDSTQYTINQITTKTIDKYINWMRSQAYAQSYINKRLNDLKAILKDSDKRFEDVELSLNLNHVSISKNRKKTLDEIIYLNFDELKLIQEANIKQKYLENARKWLILGCYTGQRGGDLLSLTPNKIHIINEKKCFIIRQQKTQKDTVIPILPEVEEMISSGFPKPISITKFREYIKEVSKIAEINQLMRGRQKISSNGATTIEVLPKWKLISTHTCRRSFATNFYGKIPTPILMRITNHSSEQQFLAYIGKPQYEQAFEIFNYL